MHPIVATEQNDPQTVAGIKAGSVSFTQVQPAVCQGYLMVLIPYEEVFDHLKPHVKYFNTGSIYVDKANVNNYNSLITPQCNQIIKFVNSHVMAKSA